jgi:nucleoside-diphosphate-sugar epimerase
MKVLVTGAAGGLGHNVVDTAVRRGVDVRALVRSPKKATFAPGVEVIAGDALDPASVTAATQGCDALFHMVNVNFSASWVTSTATMLDAAIAACRSTGARLVFPANVWVFGPGVKGKRLDESATIAPTSKKGRARAAKEERIRSSGVRYTMLRLPEFYGPHVGTLTGPPLMRIAHGRNGPWFGPADVDVEFVFMPDAAQALMTLGLADDARVNGHVFHYPGANAITPRAFLRTAIEVAGMGGARFLPSWVVRVAALGSTQAREFADILHLWTDPVLLDGKKLAATFPDVKTTSYRDGLAQTIAWLRAHPDAAMHF